MTPPIMTIPSTLAASLPDLGLDGHLLRLLTGGLASPTSPLPGRSPATLWTVADRGRQSATAGHLVVIGG